MNYHNLTIAELLLECGVGCKPPQAGTGVHDWIWQVAIRTKAYSAEEVANFIHDAVEECGRIVPFREIHDAIQNARKEKTILQLLDQKSTTPKWPKFDAELAAIHSADAAAIEKLAGLSCVHPGTQKPRDVLPALFLPDEFVCVGTRMECAFTYPLNEIIETERVDTMPLIVPNPMRGFEGLAKAGHSSPRCNDNVAFRRYLVVEFDRPSCRFRRQITARLVQLSWGSVPAG